MTKTKTFKHTGFALILAVLISAVFLLSACGGQLNSVLLNSNFTNGNAGLFTPAAGVVITDNEDNSITVGKRIQKGAHISFGAKELDTTWDSKGYTTSITFYLDIENIGNGELFEITSAVNGKDGKYLTESVVTFQKSGNEFNIVAWNGTSKSTVNETITETGWYTLEQSFYGKEGLLFVDVKITNEDNDVILLSTGKLSHVEYGESDSETWFNGCSEDLIKDMRYIWICNQQLESGLKINNVQLIKN